MLGSVIDRVQQHLLAVGQVLEYLRALIEEMVQQLGCHDRIVCRVVAPLRQHDIGQFGAHEIVVQILAALLLAVGLLVFLSFSMVNFPP